MAALNWKPFKKDTCSVCRAMSNTTIHNRLGDFLISSHVYLRYYTYSLFKMTCFYIILIINRSNRLLPCCWRVKCFTFLSCWIRPFTDSRALFFTSSSKISIFKFRRRRPRLSFCPHCFVHSNSCYVLKRPMHSNLSPPLTGRRKKETTLQKGIYHFLVFWPWVLSAWLLIVCVCMSILKILISRSSFQTSTNFVRQTKQKKTNKKI